MVGVTSASSSGFVSPENALPTCAIRMLFNVEAKVRKASNATRGGPQSRPAQYTGSHIQPGKVR
jgi:hypothetical protein